MASERGKTTGYRIERIDVTDAARHLDRLADLLRDVVEDGAPLGFLPPLASAEPLGYWRGALRAITAGTRRLLLALENGDVLGSVQVDLATMPNGRHRAEVMKLMVHRRARGRGIGRALMLAVEDAARDDGRTLLVLDTRRGDVAERLYERLGYTHVGVTPRYASSAAGTLEDTVYFYRELLAYGNETAPTISRGCRGGNSDG